MNASATTATHCLCKYAPLGSSSCSGEEQRPPEQPHHMLPATISRYTYLLSILSSILDALACRLLGPPLPLLCGDFVS